jgi:hypothetical protein
MFPKMTLGCPSEGSGFLFICSKLFPYLAWPNSPDPKALNATPTLIHAWKKELLSNAAELFQSGAKSSSVEHEALEACLYEQIGRLKTELDWLKKRLLASVEDRRALVDPGDRLLSVSRQCELLGLSRSSF